MLVCMAWKDESSVFIFLCCHKCSRLSATKHPPKQCHPELTDRDLRQSWYEGITRRLGIYVVPLAHLKFFFQLMTLLEKYVLGCLNYKQAVNEVIVQHPAGCNSEFPSRVNWWITKQQHVPHRQKETLKTWICSLYALHRLLYMCLWCILTYRESINKMGSHSLQLES